MVPHDLIQKPKKINSSAQRLVLFIFWLLTIVALVALRRISNAALEQTRISDMLVDAVGRALVVSVAPVVADRQNIAEHFILADLTLFGMLVSSMCAGIFFEQYIEGKEWVQRIQTLDDLCADQEMVLLFTGLMINDISEIWRRR